MKKKVLSFVLAVAMVLSLMPAFLSTMATQAYAYTAHSQAEGVAWASARANEGWCVDVDGYYGCQCVDLILAYYDYLGVRRSSGNACDYAHNSLPAGWTRVYSNPQPGDIIVWGAGAALQSGGYTAHGTYGHIGIITAIVNSTQVSTVETNTYNHQAAKAFYARYSSTAACFIRPDFTSTFSATWEESSATQITQTNALLKGKINYNQRANCTQAGIRVTNAKTGARVAAQDEYVNYNYTYVTYSYDITGELGVTLTPGTTYNYNFYAIINGKEYWSPVRSFTTAGHTHSYTNRVVAPTCTAKGYTTHTCSCGSSYTDSYTNALGHYFSAWTQTTAPTCTANGVEVRRCTRCGASETRSVASLGHNYQNGACTRCGAKDASFVAAPTIKIGTSAGHPKLSWSAVDGATKYYIFRSTDGKNYKQYTYTSKTSYTNKSTKIGTKYYYKVKAAKVVNGSEILSAYSNTKSITCIPAAPSLSISSSSGKPKLTWKAVDGATMYFVYRSTDGKTFKYYDSTTKTSYTNKSAKIGTKYYYKVKAVKVVNGENVKSAYSAAKSIMCRPAAPSLSIAAASGKPKLTWKAVTGADKYYIYRSTDGKTYKYYSSASGTSFTNKSAAKGKTYYYKIKAVKVVNGVNVTSAYSNAKSLKATK